MKNPLKIENAEGKLGVMLVGLGAVSTTTIAGVIAVRRGLAKPIGSLTQMGTIRLGKRTEGRSPAIHDFVPLASLDLGTVRPVQPADLAEAPTFALGLAKKLFHAAVGPSLDSYLEIESLVQPQLHTSADNAEGVAAFREKRKPNFIGR